MDNWRDRMAKMVCDILNDGRNLYALHFKNDTTFWVERGDVTILHTETFDHLPSHWKKYAEETILKIVNDKIHSYKQNS